MLGNNAKTSPATNKEKAKTTATYSKKAITVVVTPAIPIKVTALKSATPGKVKVTPRKSNTQLFNRGSLPYS